MLFFIAAASSLLQAIARLIAQFDSRVGRFPRNTVIFYRVSEKIVPSNRADWSDSAAEFDKANRSEGLAD